MEKFFKDFFLEGSSMYTLFGSKPISAQMLVMTSEEEFRKSTLYYLEKEGTKEKEKTLDKALKSFREDDFLENWNKWIAFIEKYPQSPFLFAKHPTLSEKIFSAHILNIQQTIWTLQDHYTIFKKELGYDFDPILVTMDFKNEDSEFWKGVFSSHLLTGIVYGFGYKNSYFFAEGMKLGVDTKMEGPIFSSKIRGISQGHSTLSIDDLPLPRFRSFTTPFNQDPVFEMYKSERKKIREKLNSSNFFEMIFLQLTGDLYTARD